jgi:hypothetical protein
LDKTNALGLELLLPEVSIVYDFRKLGLLNKPLERGEPPIHFKETETNVDGSVHGDQKPVNAELATPVASGQL